MTNQAPKKTWKEHVLRALFIVPIIVVVPIAILSSTLNLRIPQSESIPFGIYRLTKATPPYERGEVILGCIEDREIVSIILTREYMRPGQCRSGIVPIGKPLLAIAGDTIELNTEAIRVNGKIIPKSETLSHDSKGAPLPIYPRGTYIVEENDFWLFSDYIPNSFDSRYFGPIPKENIVGRLTKLSIR
jgi:conjugative transfer signal peptidase TraF